MRALDEPPPAPDGAQAVSGRQAPFGHRMPEALRRQNAGIVQPRVSNRRPAMYRGQTQRPPANSVSGCGSSAAARLDALCGQPPALTSVHSFSTYTQLSTDPESHGVTRSRGLRARKTTVDSPTASTN